MQCFPNVRCAPGVVRWVRPFEVLDGELTAEVTVENIEGRAVNSGQERLRICKENSENSFPDTLARFITLMLFLVCEKTLTF